MCGIVGYTGVNQAAPILLDGLSKLEYRGYDSAGVAVYNGTELEVVKAKGRLQALRDLTNDGKNLDGTVGIGHTRWATHGEPSVVNAHPQYNTNKTVAVVHNGIIENYQVLREKLESRGFQFVSATDTEVIAHMLEYYHTGNPIETIAKIIHRVKGSYALGIVFKEHPDEVYAVRKDSPLIVGVSAEGNYIASDVPAILKYTRNVYFIEDLEIVKLTKDSVSFYNEDVEPVEKEMHQIEWDIEAAEKGGYEHFMLKEIYEQPKAIEDTIRPRIKDGEIVIDELCMTPEEMKEIKKIYIVGCGSAYHTGVVGKYVFEKLARIPVEIDLASEFRYRNPIIEENSLVIIISQSGETADSKAAILESKASIEKSSSGELSLTKAVSSSVLLLEPRPIR